jgi:sugar phosphate isomerase/epimerase
MTDLGARFAVCERVLRQGSFASDVALARAAGITGIGVDAAEVDRIGVDEAVRILDGEGVRASSYLPLDDILGPSAAADLDGTARQLDIAACLGAPGALVGTGPIGSRASADADARCREWLTAAGALATERDLRIMLEPMHPLMRRWSYVHTVSHALTLTDTIAGVGIVVDLAHVWWEPGLEEHLRASIDDIVSVQVANVDTIALEEARYERGPLHRGDVPVAGLVGILETGGYRGWYEDEILVRAPREERLELVRASSEWFNALGLASPADGHRNGSEEHLR